MPNIDFASQQGLCLFTGSVVYFLIQRFCSSSSSQVRDIKRIYETPTSPLASDKRSKRFTSDPADCVEILLEKSGANSLTPITVVDLFQKCVEKHSNKVALALKRRRDVRCDQFIILVISFPLIALWV